MCPVRGDLPHPVPLRPYQCLYVDSKARDKDTRLYITQVLKYRGDTHLGKRQLIGSCKYVFLKLNLLLYQGLVCSDTLFIHIQYTHTVDEIEPIRLAG
jgi:hypothetical protein